MHGLHLATLRVSYFRAPRCQAARVTTYMRANYIHNHSPTSALHIGHTIYVASHVFPLHRSMQPVNDRNEFTHVSSIIYTNHAMYFTCLFSKKIMVPSLSCIYNVLPLLITPFTSARAATFIIRTTTCRCQRRRRDGVDITILSNPVLHPLQMPLREVAIDPSRPLTLMDTVIITKSMSCIFHVAVKVFILFHVSTVSHMYPYPQSLG